MSCRAWAGQADRDHHLVQVPGVSRPRAQLSQIAGKGRPELQHPPPDRLVRDVETPLRQEFLDVSVAEGEPSVEPDRVSDHLGWEAMTSVGDALHALILRQTPLSVIVAVTTPRAQIVELELSPREI